MRRLLGLVAMLLAIAMGAIVTECVVRGPDMHRDARGLAFTDAFEPTQDSSSPEAPLFAPDLSDDDDSDDEEEVSADPSVVVAIRSPDLICTATQPETIRPSLGHPRGIEDPPRS